MVAILYIAGTLFVSAWMPLNDAILVNAFPEGRRYSRWRAAAERLLRPVRAVVAGVVYATTGFTAALVVVGIGGLAVWLRSRHGCPTSGGPTHLVDADRGRSAATRSGSSSPGRATPSGSRRSCPRSSSRPSLVALGYMAGSTYIGLRMIDLGGGSVDVGLAGSLSAAVEIPGMILAGVVATRFGLRVLFVSSGVILTVIPGSWAVLTDVNLILLTRALVGIGFAGMLVSGVLTMRSPTAVRTAGVGPDPLPGDPVRVRRVRHQRPRWTAVSVGRVPGPVRPVRRARGLRGPRRLGRLRACRT